MKLTFNPLTGNFDYTGGDVAWGSITGTLSDQTDLQTALNARVADTGDTMTGQLVISDGGLDVQGTAVADAIKTTIGLNLSFVTPPNNNALTLALVADGGAGNLGIGVYRYYVAYETDLGVTEISGNYAYTGTAITTDATHKQVTVTVPVSTDARVTKRRIYRTQVGYGYSFPQLLATINDNTTATYNDNIADASMPATTYFYQANTTNYGIMRDGSKALNVDTNLTSLGYLAASANAGGGWWTVAGYNAARYITTGNDLIAIGHNVMANPSMTAFAQSIIAIGDAALYGITSSASTQILALGHGAGRFGGGSYTTAIGIDSLYAVGGATGAFHNVALGFRTGYSITSGNGNLFLGNMAGYRHTSGANQLYIDMAGYTTPRASNTVEQENGWIYGNFNTGGRLQINMPSTTTNAVREILRLQTYVSTASTGGANGFGGALNFYLETATNDTYQKFAYVNVIAVDAANATRKGKLQLGATDTADRLGLEIEATGAVSKNTFFGGVLFPYVAKTADYTLTVGDYTVNCTANSFNITLPTAAGFTGQVYNIKNSGTGVITILTTSSQTIDGGASGSITLDQYENLTVQSDGANWMIL